MPTKPAPPLIAAPYAAPRTKIGGVLFCRVRGSVEVLGMTDAPIPWPYTRHTDGPRVSLIVCNDLERAVRTESSMAICYWWGTSKKTVWTWRKALGVTGTTGTRRARSRHARDVIGPLNAARAARPTARQTAAIRSLVAAGETDRFIASTVGVPAAAVRRERISEGMKDEG